MVRWDWSLFGFWRIGWCYCSCAREEGNRDHKDVYAANNGPGFWKEWVEHNRQSHLEIYRSNNNCGSSKYGVHKVLRLSYSLAVRDTWTETCGHRQIRLLFAKPGDLPAEENIYTTPGVDDRGAGGESGEASCPAPLYSRLPTRLNKSMANGPTVVREFTQVCQWFHVECASYPCDYCCRRLRKPEKLSTLSNGSHYTSASLGNWPIFTVPGVTQNLSLERKILNT